MREEAIAGDSVGTLYIDMSADPGCDRNGSRSAVEANPSFLHRMSERSMLRLRKKLRNEGSWRRDPWEFGMRVPERS